VMLDSWSGHDMSGSRWQRAGQIRTAAAGTDMDGAGIAEDDKGRVRGGSGSRLWRPISNLPL
jgi:hypothetical protein